VEVFGWPLIVFAIGAAIGIVWFSSALAIKQTDRLLRSGI
jgi:hypothetical protein